MLKNKINFQKELRLDLFKFIAMVSTAIKTEQ
jgi:hypothetical protein